MDIHTPDHLVFVYNMAAGIDEPQVSFRAHDLLARIFSAFANNGDKSEFLMKYFWKDSSYPS